MAAGVFWNDRYRRLEFRDALGNIIQVHLTQGSDPTGLPPNVTPMSYIPDYIQQLIQKAAQGDAAAAQQIAKEYEADNVFLGEFGKNPPGTTTTPAGTTVAVSQSPEMINARVSVALTAANAADAKAKLDLREQALRQGYAAIGRAEQFPAFNPPRPQPQPGQPEQPPNPADFGFSAQDVAALEQDPSYVRAFANLGGTAAGIAIMARERALDAAEQQLSERKTDLDKFNAFKALHEKVQELEAEKGDYAQDQYRDWNRQTHKITGAGGISAGGEHETNPTADLSGLSKYDRAIASARKQRDEALAAYRPKEFEWEQKERLKNDRGALQSLQEHQWKSFFPDEAERKRLMKDAYGDQWPTFATGGVYGPNPVTGAGMGSPRAGTGAGIGAGMGPLPSTTGAMPSTSGALNNTVFSQPSSQATDPLNEPTIYLGDRRSSAQVPTRDELLKHDTAQQLRAIQSAMNAELQAIAQQSQALGAQLAQGMQELQARQQQGRTAFEQQMQALGERRTAQKADFDVRISTARQQQQNTLAGYAAQQTEAAGRNPFQPQFLGQPFRPNEILRGLPPMPVRR